MGVGLHKTVLKPPFLYEETFKYPYHWLVCCLGCYPYHPRLTALLLCIGLKPWTVRFCHNSTWRCRFWVSVKASRPISFFSGRSRGTNGPIRLLSCTKCIIFYVVVRCTTFPVRYDQDTDTIRNVFSTFHYVLPGSFIQSIPGGGDFGSGLGCCRCSLCGALLSQWALLFIPDQDTSAISVGQT